VFAVLPGAPSTRPDSCGGGQVEMLNAQLASSNDFVSVQFRDW
jgi:hypothetical protein